MWRDIKDFKAGAFKRYTGVSKAVFKDMVEVLERSAGGKDGRGRKARYGIEDKLLIALEYWREYRTFFHIATSWQISESSVSRIVRWVEDSLIQDKRFHLPGKKALLNNATIEVVVVDATESKVERPKKNRKNAIAARKSNTPSRHRLP